jgi:hypothetical protein
MKTISKRLHKLETLFAPRVAEDADWGAMTDARDQILRLVEPRGQAAVAEMNRQLDALGPHGLWLAAVRGYLADHGFVQTGDESFAETMASAGQGTDQLRVRIAQGQIGSGLLLRFEERGIATDNTN